MGITDDRDDPRLSHGVDKEPVGQAEVYLVLSEEERAKGFVRPYRDRYVHIGIAGPSHPLRGLTPEEEERHGGHGYVSYEEYPKSDSSVVGRFWTQEQLDIVKTCGAVTTMGRPLSETTARDPGFYGATYCCACQMHRPVNEFIWDDGSNQKVGS